MRPLLSTWTYYREVMRYYLLKMGLYAMYLGIRIKTLFGVKVSEDELEDFELDLALSLATANFESDTDYNTFRLACIQCQVELCLYITFVSKARLLLFLLEEAMDLRFE